MTSYIRLAAFALAALSLAPALGAQTGRVTRVVYARLGVDANEVGELHRWQRTEQEPLVNRGIPIQEAAAFPAFVGGQLAAGLRVAVPGEEGAVTFGLETGLSSTGGRLYYEDYSGTFVVDRTARRVFAGLFAEYTLGAIGPVRPHAAAHFRGSATTVTYERSVEVEGATVELVTASMRARPWSIEGSLGGEVEVLPRTAVRVEAGWEFGFLIDLPLAPDLPEEARLVTPGVRWGGPRAGVGVSRRF